MELISVALVAGAVGASSFVNSHKEQILNKIEQKLDSMVKSDHRLVLDSRESCSANAQAVLKLD